MLKFRFLNRKQLTTFPFNREKKGTFAGVFTPSILAILGVILYLRMGWIVGNVGLLGTLSIVTLSTLIMFLTTLSISAVATARLVRGGGVYYMISRSLGIETGGAVGIPLYFAQTLSVALYTLGFTESVVNQFPQFNQLYVALTVTVLIGLVALTSSDLATKVQYLVMGAIALSLLSFFFGKPVEQTEIEMWGASEQVSEPFWQVFAVFFPAVTGIMSGVNTSGDLKNPTKSIPVGTLAAVGTGYLIYMILPLVIATRADAKTLVETPLIMKETALWGPAILLGVWGATLSSALGSMFGAPPILQALARDRVLPRWMRFLGKGSGANEEPRLGTATTLAIVVAAVYIGDLNRIAPVLTMFFLTTYMVLNLSAAIESFLRSPSFRPKFKVHWSLSLVGAVGCLAVMFLINAVATIMAAIISLGLFFWLQRRELEVSWGDVRRGLWMALLRIGVYQLNPTFREQDPKNWRPHILVLSGAPTKRWSLIELANSLIHERGLITVSSVVKSDSRDLVQQEQIEWRIRKYLDKKGVQALVRVVMANDVFAGVQDLVKIYGLGSIVPNTILMGYCQSLKHRSSYCKMIAQIHQAKRNVVIFRDNRQRGFGKRRRIDIWWGESMQANGDLMLLLADLLRNDLRWREANIYIKLVVHHQNAVLPTRDNLNQLLTQSRISAIPQIIVADGRSFDRVLQETSRNADIIFLGMATPDKHFPQHYERLQRKVDGLPSTAFVLAAPNSSFVDMFRDFGENISET